MSTMQTAMKMALMRTMPNPIAPCVERVCPMPSALAALASVDSRSGPSSVHKRRGAASPPAAMAKLLLCFYNGRSRPRPAAPARNSKSPVHVGHAANARNEPGGGAPPGARLRLHRPDRGGAAGGVRRLPRLAFRGLDRAADAALRQPAARPDRGADLWPRMAARLRQAAAAAVVAR